MKIKFDSKTIEISKAFAARASKFGSEEYISLRRAINDLPSFQVVVKVGYNHRKTYMKGLTYAYMETRISEIDEDGFLMQQFRCLRQDCSYNEIKKWFLTVFPAVNNCVA